MRVTHLSLSLSSGLDRSGFGPGWSLGVSFIDPATPPYDSQHRLVARTILAGSAAVQNQTATYPPVRAAEVPANYARPTATTPTYSATSSVAGGATASGSRTVTTSRAYDSHGLVTQSTDETGTTTATAYDGTFGLITSVTITGTDGSRSQTTNVLSADHKTISSTPVHHPADTRLVGLRFAGGRPRQADLAGDGALALRDAGEQVPTLEGQRACLAANGSGSSGRKKHSTVM
jgi:YD repeat-containing protein